MSNPLMQSLLPAVREMFAAEPGLSVLYGYDPAEVNSPAELLAAVLSACLPEISEGKSDPADTGDTGTESDTDTATESEAGT